MTEKASADLNKYLPWAIVAVLGVMLFRQTETKPDASPSVEKITAGVIPAMRKSYGAAFNDAANEVESKRLQSDRQLLDFVKPKIEAARKDAQSPFDAMCESKIPESFDGQEKEVAALLRRIAKSW
jgi:hypothetical protein